MGSTIRNVTMSEGGSRGGYISAGSIALDKCLTEAGIDLGQVGMLINTGVYTDNHIQEPAYATMLQGKAPKRE